jgi:hypothetical protein
MLHHIPAYMATYWQLRPGVRLALVVVDGLSLDLWHIVRSVLDQSWSIREGSLFTWVPTLTAISRQALFAGCPPQFFPNSWNTTDQEPVRWRRFWAEHDLPATAIGYARNLGNADLTIGLTNLSDGPASSGQYENAARLEPALLELIEDDRVQVVGLVVNTVDDISHGMQLGTAGLHQQVQLWMTQRPYLTTLVGHLLQGRFTVFVTADHGHIWARGVGRPQEGVLVETRGQRARIYDSTTFLNLARTQIPEAIEWDNTGLPESLKVLLAPGLSAFLDPGEQAVCHGGIALEEVIVPFVQVIGHE